MSYIGAPLISTNFVLDQYTATAGQTVFTMTQAPASAQSVLVAINGVIQMPGTAYTISGTTLTFTSALSGGESVWIVHLGVRGTVTVPADGSIGYSQLGSTMAGAVVQSVYSEVRTVGVLSNAIPADDTPPQNTEGTQILTASITPKTSTNLLRVRVSIAWSHNTAGSAAIGALFRDSGVNAVAATVRNISDANYLQNMYFEHQEVAGAITPTTFALRFGPNSGASIAYVNGNVSGRFLGGAAVTSMVVEEIKV